MNRPFLPNLTYGCLIGVVSASLGASFDWRLAPAAGLGSVLALAAGEGFSWWRGRKKSPARYEEAFRGGYVQAATQAVLLAVSVYEAAVFPKSGPEGVKPGERLARRADAYAAAAGEGVPLPVQVAAQAALAALDRDDRDMTRSTVADLNTTVHRQIVAFYIQVL
ncbi:hypothetical protein [Streptomyces sp. NPDC000618]|uniref:hypothetical protein n=1 Tax=Streptomyces sp. NPDC000618 TaxID=3154265 RepID=UPI0033282219